jgi:predicted metal-dependent hydrolase
VQTQIQFVFDRLFRRQALGQFLELRTSRVGLLFVKHPRARRYVLRLGRDGLARVTIPRGGSAAQAKAFAERNIPWLEDQLSKTAALIAPKPWVGGVEILFRGNAVKLHEEDNNGGRLICFAGERVRLRQGVSDARPLVERHLWKLAARELPPLVLSMAATHGLPVRRVSVRNQRSRWGSCSRNGTISLNWRLVQTPEFVRDYIVLHELAHLKEMNHSRKFWNEVAGLCPEFRQAENWLKQNAALLG